MISNLSSVLMDQNVLLIVCDTLRKDVMQLYGGEAKTPYINTLAKDSMVYDNAIAPSPWTFPSHVSLFTGFYPSEHRIHETRTMKVEHLRDEHKMLAKERLAEYFRLRDYNTIGISNNLMVSRFTHFDLGFKYFTNIESSPWSHSEITMEARHLGASVSQVVKQLAKTGSFHKIPTYAKEFMRVGRYAKAVNYPVNKGAELTNELLMNSSLRSPFFLFVNFWELHEPYVGWNEKEILDNLTGIRHISEKKVAFLKNQYVIEAEFLDSNIGRLIEMLKLRNLYDNTMIILTSDHGQEFNENGFMTHGIYLHDQISRIPLIVKYPNGKKFKAKKGYQSLVHIPRLIKETLEGGDDSAATEKVVFAEAFGNTEGVPKSYTHRMDYLSNKYEKVRKAVYKDGYKLTINGTDGIIEEFMEGNKRLNPKQNKKILNGLIDEIDEFKGGRNFILPK